MGLKTMCAELGNPEVLVLGSSGFKSYAQLGALWYLSYFPILRNIKTYVGCSVGAIISLLLISGFLPLEIINDDKILLSLLSYIQGIRPNNLHNLISNNGLLTLDPIKEYLVSRVTSKFGFVPTLADLYSIKGAELVTVTVNISKNKTTYLSRDNYPDMSCVEAVLLSVNFPILLQRYTYGGDCYVDGSFGNPYPIDYMDDGQVRILGITVLDDPAPPNDIISYLYRIARHPVEEIRQRVHDQSSDHCYHLLIEVEQGVTNAAEMLLSGMDQAKRHME